MICPSLQLKGYLLGCAPCVKYCRLAGEAHTLSGRERISAGGCNTQSTYCIWSNERENERNEDKDGTHLVRTRSSPKITPESEAAHSSMLAYGKSGLDQRCWAW